LRRIQFDLDRVQLLALLEPGRKQAQPLSVVGGQPLRERAGGQRVAPQRISDRW